ncbi:hypothetical protein PR048_000794 [Dryococelus australis]|uniref:Uncharacterized protein n=1 Tax=Dryococelus australis TaxID=614101 RepID=A0ABQ9IGI1_9NEOP|nr:hypothetical protein PR048_000794 [Dryococelus australis]
MKGRGKRATLEKTRRPAVSSGTISTRKNPNLPGIQSEAGRAAPTHLFPPPPASHSVGGNFINSNAYANQRLLAYLTPQPIGNYSQSAVASQTLTALRGRSEDDLYSVVLKCYRYPATGGLENSRTKSREPMSVIEVSMGQRRNERVGETGDPREKPEVLSGTIPTCKNSGVTRPGIEPDSPWPEASRLTAHPPQPSTLKFLVIIANNIFTVSRLQEKLDLTMNGFSASAAYFHRGSEVAAILSSTVQRCRKHVAAPSKVTNRQLARRGNDPIPGSRKKAKGTATRTAERKVSGSIRRPVKVVRRGPRALVMVRSDLRELPRSEQDLAGEWLEPIIFRRDLSAPTLSSS